MNAPAARRDWLEGVREDLPEFDHNDEEFWAEEDDANAPSVAETLARNLADTITAYDPQASARGRSVCFDFARKLADPDFRTVLGEFAGDSSAQDVFGANPDEPVLNVIARIMSRTRGPGPREPRAFIAIPRGTGREFDLLGVEAVAAHHGNMIQLGPNASIDDLYAQTPVDGAGYTPSIWVRDLYVRRITFV